jgi:hypothetical protein
MTYLRIISLLNILLWTSCAHVTDLKDFEEDLKPLLTNPQKQLELMMGNIEKKQNPLMGFQPFFKNTIQAFKLVMKSDEKAIKKVETVGEIGEDEFKNRTMDDRKYFVLHTFLSSIRSERNVGQDIGTFSTSNSYSLLAGLDDVEKAYSIILDQWDKKRWGADYQCVFLPVTTLTGQFDLSTLNKAYFNNIGICGLSLSNKTMFDGQQGSSAEFWQHDLGHTHCFNKTDARSLIYRGERFIRLPLRKTFETVFKESQEETDQLVLFLLIHEDMAEKTFGDKAPSLEELINEEKQELSDDWGPLETVENYWKIQVKKYWEMSGDFEELTTEAVEKIKGFVSVKRLSDPQKQDILQEDSSLTLEACSDVKVIFHKTFDEKLFKETLGSRYYPAHYYFSSYTEEKTAFHEYVAYLKFLDWSQEIKTTTEDGKFTTKYFIEEMHKLLDRFQEKWGKMQPEKN